MLRLIIPGTELFDEAKEEFVIVKPRAIQLEHSLVSLSKWESKWNKPLLSRDKRTVEETTDYIRCMTITQNVPPIAYQYITNENIREVNAYIELPMTATIITNENTATSREVITSEIIYHWMISLNIPFECQKWHLNRLLTLINVCDIKSRPPKKMSRSEINRRNRELNRQRKGNLNTKG